MAEWKKIEGDGVELFNFVEQYEKTKKDVEFVGTYKRMETGIGDNDSSMYYFVDENRKLVKLWGTSVLDIRFKNLEIGELVKVVYSGLVKSSKGGRSYHNFEVYRDTTEPKSKLRQARDNAVEEESIPDEVLESMVADSS